MEPVLDKMREHLCCKFLLSRVGILLRYSLFLSQELLKFFSRSSLLELNTSFVSELQCRTLLLIGCSPDFPGTSFIKLCANDHQAFSMDSAVRLR